MSKYQPQVRFPRVGAIVRLSVFGAWLGVPGKFIWARVVSEPVNDSVQLQVLATDPDTERFIHPDWEEDWPLDRGDVWRVVSPSKVPNWVWASAAKRALTGETQ